MVPSNLGTEQVTGEDRGYRGSRFSEAREALFANPYQLGKAKGEPTRAPRFMRLLVSPEQPRIGDAGLDFRDEIMAQIFDRGDARPRRMLAFRIEVTDEGAAHGPPFAQRLTFENWRPIGTMTFDDAVISYNGDFVIHFNHPTWRSDRNDASTATRVNERKVR